MKRVAVVSLKGGCSKTTVSFNLACHWAGKSPTVAVDLDPQGSLSDLYQRREDKSNLELVQLTRTHLEGRLRSIEGFSYMVIDTPPATSVSMSGAIRAADLVVVCVRPGYSDYDSLQKMLPLLEEAQGKVLILLTQTSNTTLSKTFRQAIEGNGYPILKTELKTRVTYAESVSEGKNVTEYAKGSIASTELKKIIREIEDHL